MLQESDSDSTRIRERLKKRVKKKEIVSLSDMWQPEADDVISPLLVIFQSFSSSLSFLVL